MRGPACRSIAIAHLVACLLVASAGCSGPEAGPLDVEVVVQDGDGVRLEVQTLESIRDIHRLEGEHFSFFGSREIDPYTLPHIDDEPFAETKARATARFVGAPVRPRIVWNTDHWVAEDFDSLSLLSSFERFERVWRWADANYGALGGATVDHAPILAHPDIVQHIAGLPAEAKARVVSDNAFFFSLIDGWGVMRPGASQGLPLGAHPGVVAHEFFHRVFFRLTDPTPAPNLRREPFEFSDEVRQRLNLRRGLNEGLADIFAIAYVQDVDYLRSAFSAGASPLDAIAFSAVLDQRDVEGAFADAVTFGALADDTLPTAFAPLCIAPSENFTALDWNPYCLGTLVARVLWEAADRDAERLRDVVVPAVLQTLELLPLVQTGEGVGDLNAFFDATAIFLTGDERTRFCDAVRARLARLPLADEDGRCGR